MPVPDFLKEPLTLYEIAEQYWDLKFYPTQYVFSLLALVSDDKLERDKCIELSSAQGQEDWLNYCRRPKRTVLEVLQDFHKSTSKLTIDILFELFSPIKPRSFSIASSCLPSSGRLLDLLVAVVKYYSKLKKPRLGLGSNWLKGLDVGDKVYGWIKKGTIQFPKDTSIPLILIGPGTGLAPFRSLIQERAHGEAGAVHLFFGCRYKHKDFHCREELEGYVERGWLTMYCAFSRDQEQKVLEAYDRNLNFGANLDGPEDRSYTCPPSDTFRDINADSPIPNISKHEIQDYFQSYVQHRITEHSDTVRALIIDRHAYVYISGNSKNMPDNVRDALRGVAGDSVRDMEDSGRLQVETW